MTAAYDDGGTVELKRVEEAIQDPADKSVVATTFHRHVAYWLDGAYYGAGTEDDPLIDPSGRSLRIIPKGSHLRRPPA